MSYVDKTALLDKDIEDAWTKILSRPLNYNIYIDISRRVICLRPKSILIKTYQQKFLFFVGTYNMSISRSDFIDDIYYALGLVAQCQEAKSEI